MSSGNPNSDAALIAASLEVIRRGKERAPQDYLVALAVALVGVTAAFLVGAVITDGFLHDLCLNFAAEAFGAVLTVVVIDGVWKRREAATTSRLDAITAELRRLRHRSMTASERDAWRTFVDASEGLAKAESVADRLRHDPTRIRRLEDLADRALAESEGPKA